MRIHSLQHVPFEGIGSMNDVFDRLDYSLANSHLYRGDPLPALDDFDWLVVMGGPMGVHDEADFPWLAAEKTLIKAALDAGKRVLGICLGAQLIASALDAEVVRNTHREIGWFRVTLTDAGRDSPWAGVFADSPCVFHWHGDTFAIPETADHLLSSEACRHQAFNIGTRVLGLQFHLETTQVSAAALLEHCSDELTAGEYVQTPEEIAADRPNYVAINQLMEQVIEIMAR